MTEFFDVLNGIEIRFLDFLSENLRNPVLDKIMPAVSAVCAHGEIWIAAAILMLCFKRTRKSGIAVAIALIMGLVAGNMILKPAIGRIRPYDITGYNIIVPVLSDYSFPSGHTLSSFESAVALLLTNKRLGIPALVLAFLIAFSRLYLYVHYPTDVIAGIILGILFAYLAVRLTDKAVNRYPAFFGCTERNL